MLRKQTEEIINSITDEIENDFTRVDALIEATDAATRDDVETEIRIATEDVLGLTDSLRMRMNIGGFGGNNKADVEALIKVAQEFSKRYFALVDKVEHELKQKEI